MLHCLHHIESLEQSSRSEANARGWIARIRPIRRIRTARLIIKIISLQPIASRLYVIISMAGGRRPVVPDRARPRLVLTRNHTCCFLTYRSNVIGRSRRESYD
jgi:hypothetical protein